MGIFYNKRHCVILKKIWAKIYLAKIIQLTHNHNGLYLVPPNTERVRVRSLFRVNNSFIIRINFRKSDYGFYKQRASQKIDISHSFKTPRIPNINKHFQWKTFSIPGSPLDSIPHHNRISKTKLAANPTRRVRMGIISPPRPSLELPNFKKLTSPPKGGRSKAPSPFFICLRLYVAGEELPRTSLPVSCPFFMKTAWELCISIRASLRRTRRFSGASAGQTGKACEKREEGKN